ncbi:MAG: CoA-transferase [Xanthomonadales bacterium]|nr:CoA-transferase [Xanthomonadales bacterium]
MADKRLTEEEVVGELRSGMTVAIGGWAARRKPMSIIRAILRSDLDDLTVVSHGGPDVGLLCAEERVRKLVYAFVSLDDVPLDPHFRRAREGHGLPAEPLDEGLFHLGLQAAAWRVPFLPSRTGLGSDLFRDNPTLGTVVSPFPAEDGDVETLVAMPALRIDAALCHLNDADARGNAAFRGPDLFWDDLMLQAAPKGRRFISVERVVPTDELERGGCLHQLRVSRMSVDGVVEAPGGAHFTSCEPDYPTDQRFLKTYVDAAGSEDAWSAFRRRFIEVDPEDYWRNVRTEAAR